MPGMNRYAPLGCLVETSFLELHNSMQKSCAGLRDVANL